MPHSSLLPSNQSKSNLSNLNNLEFVYGGTFDPIHNGHLAIINLLQNFAPEIPIRLIPCSIPALKEKPFSSFEHRLAMLEIATRELNHQQLAKIIVDERENDRTGPSFMVETLLSLKKDFPDKKFILVMGEDTAIELPRWFHWLELKSLCHLLILNRSGCDAILVKSAIGQAGFKLCDNFQNFTFAASGLAFMLKMTEKSESSTQIRQNRQNNLELDSMIPQSVIKYINNHQLYIKDDH